jgi:putative protease
MIEHLPLLANTGIDSFKIEGRMKGINYVAGVVKTYREAIDLIGNGKYDLNPRWLRELSMFSSRGYTTGMFLGKQPDKDYKFDGESYRMSHELVGIVLEINNDRAKIELRNRIDNGDCIEYLSPGLEEMVFEVKSMNDIDGIDITSARNEDIIFMPVPSGIREGDLIRRRKNFRNRSIGKGMIFVILLLISSFNLLS